MTTLTKTIAFENLMKECKKYVSKSEAHPVLQYVHFDGENFTATNSHIMLKVNKDYVSEIPSSIVENSLINPITLEIVGETLHKYPDTNRIIPEYCNLNIRLNGSLDEIRSYIRADNKLLKGTVEKKLFQFIMQNDYMELRAVNTVDSERLELSQHIMKHRTVLEDAENTEYKFHVRSDYITDALMTTNKLSKLSKDDIQFKVLGSMRPIVIEQSGVFTLLIMPVRVY